MEEPPKRPQRPYDEGRAGVAERAAGIVTSMTLQNVLIIALLVMIAAPTYFVWQLIHDKDLRHDMMSSLEVLDAGVPCLVYVGQQAGQQERYTVGSGYGSEGKFERLIAIRAIGTMSTAEIKEACDLAREDADTMRKALAAGLK